MKNFKQYAVIGAMLIIAVSIYVYGGIYKANKQIQYDASKIELKQKQYADCRSDAYYVYSSDWDNRCEIQKVEKGCLLMKFQREDIETDYEKALNRCVQLYK